MSARFLIATLAVVCLTIGCEAKKENSSTSNGGAAPAAPKEVLVRLEQADAVDGKSDHVIGKCYICGLGMDGKEKFPVKVHGYTAHLCSESCQKEFGDNFDEIVLSTDVPKKAN